MDNLSIFAADNFYSLSLEEARPELERFMYSYLGIFPLQEGERPQTDGKRIFLEGRKADFKDDKNELHNNRNMSLYLTDILHEILHIREGSFLVDARPYLKTYTNEGLAHAIFNTVEDARIEHNSQEYLRPEDSELLRNSNVYLSTKRTYPTKLDDQFMEIYSSVMITKSTPSKFQPDVTKAEKTTLETVLENEYLNSDGISTVKDLLERATEISEAVYGEPVEAAWGVVPKIYDLLTKAFPNIERDFPTINSPFALVQAPMANQQKSKGKKTENKKSGEKAKGKNSDSGGDKPGGKDGSSGSGQSDGQNDENGTKQQMAYTGFRGDVHDFSAGDTQGKNVEDLVEDYKGKQETSATQKNSNEDGEVSAISHAPGKGDSERLVNIITYDDKKRAYLHIEELRVKPYSERDSSFLSELAKHGDLKRRIVEHFEMLRPNELQRIFYTDDPDELNAEAVIEVIADPSLRAQARVYNSHIINERDALTAILLDISGSTGMVLESGESVLDVEKLSAGLIYQALTEVGDEVLLYAMDSVGCANLYPVPDLENLGALRPGGGTPLSVAMRGVIADLSKNEVRDKTFVVVSDGYPNLSRSPGDPYVDTAMAFQEAESQGIKTVYMDIGNTPSDKFDIITKNTTFAQALREVRQLPNVIAEFVMEHG